MMGVEAKKEPEAGAGAEKEEIQVCLSLKRGEEPITLKVQRQNAEDVCYRMGKNVPLGVLMMDYCVREDLGQGTVQFIGPELDILTVDQTLQDLNLEDGDTINAICYYHGG